MSGLNYEFVQGLINFGQGMAGGFVGQPFRIYRLNPASNGNILDEANVVDDDYRAKMTHGRPVSQVENEYLHTNLFEVLADSSKASIGDLLKQTDDVFGADSLYAVASKRPLKKMMAVRVESLCTIYRTQGNIKRDDTYPYSGSDNESSLPFVLRQGRLVIGGEAEAPAVIPCGIQSIGQLKNFKVERLPMGVITSWWFLYVPLLPGIERLMENDIIETQWHPDDVRAKYRIHIPFYSPAGTAGQFLVCERTIA